MIEGSVHPTFAPLATALGRQLQASGGGAAVCVYLDGEPVADLWGGVRDRDGAPWERGTPSVSFSTTKGVASTALHLLVDRGHLSYDDRVADHWPEFAQNGKGEITVRELLSHQAGLHRIRHIVDGAERMLDWEHMVEALAAAPAERVAGTSAYHGLTYGHLVGELVRRVSGRPLPEFVREEIVEPLGLDGLFIGAPEAAIAKRAELLDIRVRDDGRAQHGKGEGPGPVMRLLAKTGVFDGTQDALMPRGISRFHFDAPDTLRAAIPSANGLFTARSLARVYAMLANDGRVGGLRLLRPDTVRELSRVQVRGRDRVLHFRMGWRLGYHGVGTSRGVPKRAFGHFGYGGSGAWACPSRRLSFAMTVNTGHGSPMGDLRIFRMNGVALECAGRLRRARRAIF